VSQGVLARIRELNMTNSRMKRKMKRKITPVLVVLAVLLASCTGVEIQETFTDFDKVMGV
jgi:hypothetical protein